MHCFINSSCEHCDLRFDYIGDDLIFHVIKQENIWRIYHDQQASKVFLGLCYRGNRPHNQSKNRDGL